MTATRQWDVLDVTPDLADKLGITVPSDRAILDDVEKYRTELVDTCLEMDDTAMEAYLEGTMPSIETLKKCLRKGTSAARSTRCCAAPRTRTRACSRCSTPSSTTCRRRRTSPRSRPWMQTATRSASACSDDEPFAALAFKVINDAYGALTFCRVYSGVLTKGASVQNTTRGKREKIGRMVEMFAKDANPIEEARAGDIIALVSLAETDTGDTLCDSAQPGGARAHALPGARHQRLGEAEGQGRPGEVRRTRSARWCAPIRRCASKRIAKPARPSCAAWASCTST
jgi:elongation factor G